MTSDQQRDLRIARLFNECFEAIISRIGHNHQVGRRDREHIEQHSIDVIVAEAIAVRHDNGVRSASRCRKIVFEGSDRKQIRAAGCANVE